MHDHGQCHHQKHDGELECAWHGFRFNGKGRCTAMPSEGADARIPDAMHARPAHLAEDHGLVWMYFGEEKASYPPLPFFDELAGGLSSSTEVQIKIGEIT